MSTNGAAQGAAIGTTISPGWGTAIGAGLGAIGFLDGGDSPTTTSTQGNSAPWRAQQPYLLDIFSEANRLYGQRMPGYGGAYSLPPGYQQALQQAQQTQQAANQGTSTYPGDPSKLDLYSNLQRLEAQYEQSLRSGGNGENGAVGGAGPSPELIAARNAVNADRAAKNNEAGNVQSGDVSNVLDNTVQPVNTIPGSSNQPTYKTQSNGSLNGGRPTQYADAQPTSVAGAKQLTPQAGGGNYQVQGGFGGGMLGGVAGALAGAGTPAQQTTSGSPWSPNFNRVAGFSDYQKSAQQQVGGLYNKNAQSAGSVLDNATKYADPFNMPLFQQAGNAELNRSSLLGAIANNASQTPSYDITSKAGGYIDNAASTAPSFASPDALFSPQMDAINKVNNNQRGDTYAANTAIDRVMSNSQGQPTGPDATSAIQSQLSGAPNMSVWQPIIDSTVTDAANQFNRQIAPAINHGAIGSGNFGSSKYQQAMGLAASESQKNVQRQLAEMGVQIGTDALGRQTQGIGAAQNQQGINNTVSRGANADVMSAAGLGLSQASLNNTIGRGNNSDILQAAGLGGSLTNSWLDNQQRTAGMQLNAGNATGGLQLNQAQLNEGVQGQRQAQLANAASQYGNQFNSIYQPGLGFAANMSNQAPDLLQSTYTPSTMLNAYGGQQQAQNQAMLDQQYQNWQLNQNGPWDMLAKYGSAVQGDYGGLTNSSTVQQTPSNSNSQLLGSLITAYGAYKKNNPETVNNTAYSSYGPYESGYKY